MTQSCRMRCIKGMISGLGDKYSTYYTKEEYEAIKTAQEGYYRGIGVTVTLDGDKLQVTGVQDDTPGGEGRYSGG